MYENFDEMQELAKKAKERLSEQLEEDTNDNIDEDEVEDLYADFRDDYEDYNNEEYERLSNEYEEVYNENQKLNSEFEYEPVPKLREYDEPLFPGGPGKTQIESWKKEWEGYDIYVTEVLNDVFVFRTLNRFEYKQLVSLQKVDALQREEVICQTVTLWPENYTWKEMATSKAGVPSTYSDIIMEKSGFTKDYAIQVL